MIFNLGRPTTSNHTQFLLHNLSHLSRHKSFGRHRPTVLFVSGWMMSPDAETSQLLIRTYLKRCDYNVLVLDWSDYSVGTYYSVMIRISKISRIVGQSLKKLFDKGLDVNSFHCVGHSFGAHSCGIMGRELLQVSHQKYKLGRLVRQLQCLSDNEAITFWIGSPGWIPRVRDFIQFCSINRWTQKTQRLWIQSTVTSSSSEHAMQRVTWLSFRTTTTCNRDVRQWTWAVSTTILRVTFVV